MIPELTDESHIMRGGLSMYKKKIVIGVAPTKRSFLSMEEAKRQKDRFMKVIRGIDREAVTLVDLDDVCENGIAFRLSDVPAAVKKFKED